MSSRSQERPGPCPDAGFVAVILCVGFRAFLLTPTLPPCHGFQTLGHREPSLTGRWWWGDWSQPPAYHPESPSHQQPIALTSNHSALSTPAAIFMPISRHPQSFKHVWFVLSVKIHTKMLKECFPVQKRVFVRLDSHSKPTQCRM